MRQFADALGAESAVAEGNLLKEHVNRRNILRGRHNVVGHLVVGHVAVLPDDFFVERVADALRDAAFDLPCGQHRMQHAAHLLHRPELLYLGGIGDRVHCDLRHVNGPRIRGVRLAVILLIVPVDAGRRFVTAQRRNFAMSRAIALAGRKEFLARVARAKSCVLAQDGQCSCKLARSIRRPTTIEVREATVGPLLGMRPVSGAAMATSP